MYEYEKKYDHVVTYETEGHVATISLDCPENLNRLGEQLIDELGAALDRVHWDPQVRVAILRGNGPVSFGPGDLSIISTKLAKDLPTGRQVMYEIGNLVRKLVSIPEPVIGVADGQCLGGGANLLLSCDLVVASSQASFQELFSLYAMSPDTGGLWALQRLVGPMRAKQLAMTAETIDAATAQRYGMVLEVVDPDKTLLRAQEIAEQIAAKSPVGIGHTKLISNRLQDYTLDTYLQVEADYLCLGALSGDFKETVAAGAQQRAPQYTGR